MLTPSSCAVDPFELMPPDVALELLPATMFSYDSPSGERIVVDVRMDALAVLGIPDTSGKNGQIAFRRLIATPNRQKRATVSLAYMMVLKRSVTVIHILAAIGNTTVLRELCSMRPAALHSRDEFGRTPLYLAARSGYVDMCTYLLYSQRCDVNAQQGDKSTALHAACFFNHRPVAELLLEAGAKHDIKNQYNATAADETHDPAMKLVLFGTTSAVAQLRQDCVATGVVGAFNPLLCDGAPIGFVAARPASAEAARDLAVSQLAFHGTKAQHVVSILKAGLRPSGTKLPDGTEITPPPGHYTLDKEYGGVKGWAKAVFLSPSVTYAAHPAYAEAILDANSVRHRVIVLARVKPGSYTCFTSTVTSYVVMPGEVGRPEFRVTDVGGAAGGGGGGGSEPALPLHAVETVMPGEATDGEIMRIEAQANVVVVGLLLLRQSFIDNLPPTMTLEKFKAMVEELLSV